MRKDWFIAGRKTFYLNYVPFFRIIEQVLCQLCKVSCVRRDETRWENLPHTFQLIYSLRGKFPCMCVCRITDRAKQNTRLFKNLFFLSYLATEFCSPTFSRPTQLIHCTLHCDAHNLMHPDGGWLLLKLPPLPPPPPPFYPHQSWVKYSPPDFFCKNLLISRIQDDIFLSFTVQSWAAWSLPV